MDVARILFAVTFTFLNVACALAAPPPAAKPHTANFAGQSDWSSAGPTTAPTISANRNDRYAYPQLNTTSPPPSIVDRTQNAFSETATTLRDGFNAGVRAATDNSQGFNQQFQDWSGAASRQLQSAGNTVRSTAEQTLGTTNTRTQSTNPFAPAATTAAPRSRNGLAPPTTWPTTPTSTTLAAPNWNDSTVPAAPDRSMFASPPAPQASGTWSSIGTTVPAPPLLIPQLPTTTSRFTSTNNTTTTSTSAFPADGFRDRPSIHSPLVSASPPPTTSSTARSTPAFDDWPGAWDKNANTANNASSSGASISRNGTGSPPAIASRYTDFPATQPVTVAAQDQKKTTTANAKSTDHWADDSWNRPQPSAPIAPAAPTNSVTISKSAPTSTPNNSPPASQPGANPPVLNPPIIASTSAPTTTIAPVAAQQPTTTTTAAKPNQQAAASPAAGEQQPWVPLLAAVLTLVGSLAANLFLGWSYLDARQKYQSLVRRTADTFRRAKPAAA